MKMFMRIHMIEHQSRPRERSELRPDLCLQLPAQCGQRKVPHSIQPHPVPKAPPRVDEIGNLLAR
jgi:hypothetical protein